MLYAHSSFLSVICASICSAHWSTISVFPNFHISLFWRSKSPSLFWWFMTYCWCVISAENLYSLSSWGSVGSRWFRCRCLRLSQLTLPVDQGTHVLFLFICIIIIWSHHLQKLLCCLLCRHDVLDTEDQCTREARGERPAARDTFGLGTYFSSRHVK